MPARLVTVPAPLPASGSAWSVTRFTEIWDKGKAVVIVSETSVTDLDGRPLWPTRRSIFARGEGGFADERRPSTSVIPPDRARTSRCRCRSCRIRHCYIGCAGTAIRCTPIRNSLRRAGFPRPILHSLCTYGVACKAIVDTFLDSDVSRVHSYGARFAGVLFPGETLRARIWEEDSRLVATVTASNRDDASVLSGVELVPFSGSS
jgi:hypothetical protein